MIKKQKCEYCSRLITSKPVNKILRNRKHVFCSEFCFRLYFYDVPVISYENLQKMYSFYCVSVPAQEFRKVLNGLKTKED
jgi:hypothetical protein